MGNRGVSDALRGADLHGRPLRVLHVLVQATPTNSQWNEHCLPQAGERHVTVCSLLPPTVPGDPRINRYEGDGSVRGALAALRRALRAGQYDVVHVHAPISVPLMLAASVLERRGLSDVVFTLHNSWPNLRPRNRVLAAAALMAFPVVVACSDAVARSIPRPLRRLARQRVAVVPNGVDVDRIDRALVASYAPVERPDGLTVLSIGRMIPIKNQAALLEAFADAAGPRDRLVLIGDGPLRPELEQQAERLGIGARVEMPGVLPRDEVYRRLGEADLFVSPSRGEGLPLAVLEAMAARLPAIISDIPPHREIVRAAGGGTLIAPDDVRGLSAAVAGLLRTAPADRLALGAAGRSGVVDRLSVRHMGQGYHQIYERLAGCELAATKEPA